MDDNLKGILPLFLSDVSAFKRVGMYNVTPDSYLYIYQNDRIVVALYETDYVDEVYSDKKEIEDKGYNFVSWIPPLGPEEYVSVLNKHDTYVDIRKFWVERDGLNYLLAQVIDDTLK